MSDHVCPQCGSDELMAVHEFTIVTARTTTAPCTCGTHDIAGYWEGTDETHVTEWYWLEEGLSPHFEDREEEPGDSFDGDSEIFCGPCVEAAEEWEYEYEAETEVDEDSYERGIECAACGLVLEEPVLAT
jgi:hypothetical protein